MDRDPLVVLTQRVEVFIDGSLKENNKKPGQVPRGGVGVWWGCNDAR